MPTRKTVKRQGYVALLRGINVAGKNLLPMKELSALCAGLGVSNVQTYIQSGNVVFSAEAARAKELETELATCIAGRFGFEVPVVMRSGAELSQAVERNPFLANGSEPDTLHVMFLAGVPTASAVAALDPKRSPPDQFVVVERDI